MSAAPRAVRVVRAVRTVSAVHAVGEVRAVRAASAVGEEVQWVRGAVSAWSQGSGLNVRSRLWRVGIPYPVSVALLF